MATLHFIQNSEFNLPQIFFDVFNQLFFFSLFFPHFISSFGERSKDKVFEVHAAESLSNLDYTEGGTNHLDRHQTLSCHRCCGATHHAACRKRGKQSVPFIGPWKRLFPSSRKTATHGVFLSAGM